MPAGHCPRSVRRAQILRHGVGRHYQSIGGAGIAVPGMVDSRNNVMAYGSAVWGGGKPAPELHGQGPDRLLRELAGKLGRRGRSIRLFTGASASLAGCLREAGRWTLPLFTVWRPARPSDTLTGANSTPTPGRIFCGPGLTARADDASRRRWGRRRPAGPVPWRGYTARLPESVDAVHEYLKGRGLPRPKAVHVTGTNADLIPPSHPDLRRRSIRVHHRSQPLAWEGIRVFSEGGLRLE